jgi:hypothetical protein
MQRARPDSGAVTLRHKNDEVGLPCKKTGGPPVRWST